MRYAIDLRYYLAYVYKNKKGDRKVSLYIIYERAVTTAVAISALAQANITVFSDF